MWINNKNFCNLLSLFCSILIVSLVPKAIHAQDKDLEAAQELTRQTPFSVIKEKIDYSFGYGKEKEKFLAGLRSIKATTKRDATVLVNFHLGNTLNLTSTYDPKKRTLIWGTPYQIALNQALSTSKHAHDQSALLTTWTRGKMRGFLSLVVIPKNTEMEFLVGGASPQKEKDELRPGEGMQLRLKYLPEGTVVLTQDLASVKKGPKGTLNLKKILSDLIEEFNKQPMSKGHKIDKSAAEDFDFAVATGDNMAYVRQFFKDIKMLKYPPR